jgi:uncharacterized protein (DUF2132 family)
MVGRLLYLRHLHDENGWDELESFFHLSRDTACFDPSVWSQAEVIERTPLYGSEIPDEILDEMSWWVGLFFYQLPWEYLHLPIQWLDEGQAAVEPSQTSRWCFLSDARSLQILWEGWMMRYVVLKSYRGSDAPALLLGWSEAKQHRLERLLRELFRQAGFQSPTWWRTPTWAWHACSLEGESELVQEILMAKMAMEKAFLWLARFVDTPYERWSLDWTLIELVEPLRQLQGCVARNRLRLVLEPGATGV